MYLNLSWSFHDFAAMLMKCVEALLGSLRIFCMKIVRWSLNLALLEEPRGEQCSTPQRVMPCRCNEIHMLLPKQASVPDQKFFRRKSARDLLPAKPVEISVEPWWVAQTSYITEDDVRVSNQTTIF